MNKTSFFLLLLVNCFENSLKDGIWICLVNLNLLALGKDTPLIEVGFRRRTYRSFILI